MIQNNNATGNWESFNGGIVLPIVGANYSIAQLGTVAVPAPMPAGAVRAAMYAKVDPVKAYTSQVGFRVYFASGYGTGGLTGGKEIYHDKVAKSSGSSAERAATCAEHHMYEAIKGKLANNGYMVVTQTVAPCRQCISSYSGLAAAKTMTIMVYFQEGYDILKAAPGLLVIDSAGTTYWFD